MKCPQFYDPAERAIDYTTLVARLEPQDEAISQAGEFLKLTILWATEGVRQKTPKAIALRLLAAMRVISPACFDHESFARLAKAEGVSREILSRYAREFRAKFLERGRGKRKPPRMRPRGGLGKDFDHYADPLHKGDSSTISSIERGAYERID